MLKLSENFISQFRGKQPNWGFGDLSYVTYKRTYAKKKLGGQQEEFWETCQRVIESIFSFQKDYCNQMGLPWNARKAQHTAQNAYTRMFAMKWLPPGRGLEKCDYDLVKKLGSAMLNNCAFVSTSDLSKNLGDPFSWCCNMLMHGVGVGADTRGAGTVVIQKPTGDTVVHVISDDKEGWYTSVQVLLDSYDGRNRRPIKFDYSPIREAGAILKTFGGTASGPEVLKDGHQDIRDILDLLDGLPITSLAIVDIFNIVGRFVVAGGTRRSAEIMFGEINDQEYLSAKDPDKHEAELRSHRWMSNNSVFVDVHDDFFTIVEQIKKSGEPGLYFMDNARHYGRTKDPYYPDGHEKCEAKKIGGNPCLEQVLEDRELCTLVETFPAHHDSLDDFLETLKVAYLYAKTVTLIPTHCPETNQVMIRNRRIGLSQSGVQQAIKKFGSQIYLKQYCDQAYDYVEHLDRIYSRWLGCPTSFRKTTVKPSGTTSLVAGSFPGIHAPHSEYYWRTMRMSSNDALVKKLLAAKYRIEISCTDKKQFQKAIAQSGQKLQWRDDLPIELLDSVTWKAFQKEAGTVVIYFGVHEKDFTKSKFDISLWEQMILVKELQRYWSDNAVSCTITFNEKEARDLQQAIEFFAPYVKSMSFLPLTNHKYKQAPYQECTKEEYEAYSKQIKPLNLAAVKGNAKGEKYCTNDTCSF